MICEGYDKDEGYEGYTVEGFDKRKKTGIMIILVSLSFIVVPAKFYHATRRPKDYMLSITTVVGLIGILVGVLYLKK